MILRTALAVTCIALSPAIHARWLNQQYAKQLGERTGVL
jgi:hypothetical protein